MKKGKKRKQKKNKKNPSKSQIPIQPTLTHQTWTFPALASLRLAAQKGGQGLSLGPFLVATDLVKHQPRYCCEGIFYMRLTFTLLDFE